MEDTRCIVENTARRLGYTVNSDGALEGAPEPVDMRRSERRWLRVPGFGR